MKEFTGRVWLLPDDVDTDIIIPTEYLALPTVDDMKQYAFSPLREDLAKQIKPGDIIVAGKNFGCGSSREQAPEIIKHLGVACVIAKSYARIFFRNSSRRVGLCRRPDDRGRGRGSAASPGDLPQADHPFPGGRRAGRFGLPDAADVLPGGGQDDPP